MTCFNFEVPGQMSVLLKPQSPLQLADTIVATRLLIRSVAKEHSLTASFSPAPPAQQGTEYGMSILISFKGISHDPENNPGSLLCSTGDAFAQGVLDHLPALTALTLYSSNSFVRLSGDSISRRVAWSTTDSGTPVVISRNYYSRDYQLAYKLCDNSCNVHLALAGLLWSGVDGMLRQRALQVPFDELCETPLSTSFKLCPPNLADAITSLSEDIALMNLLPASIRGPYLLFRRRELTRLRTMSGDEERQVDVKEKI